ncbi:MAG: bifunctional riboflavin kinase/FAD synthetase [Psychromonas sp.]|nr:bifunctional riboflavin kinase/FAD synthetase [Psychromonas sp.]
MELIRGIHNLRAEHKGCVLSIGNFDGVHLGHQLVLSRLSLQAKRMNLPSTVLIFEPQPAELFRGLQAPARLCRLRDKYIQLKKFRLDRLVCLSFSPKFASLSADEFVHSLLINQLGVKFLVVGDDFRFGYKRRGDFQLLQQSGKQFGFEVIDTQSFTYGNTRVSSSRIRDALSIGDLDKVSLMLGRKFSVSGRVCHGKKLGRTLGVPTANVLLGRQVSPVFGVFLVSVVFGNIIYYGVANIGNSPTVNNKKQSQLEVHIFDFDRNVYGKQIEVTLEKKLREEVHFESIDQLKTQIEKDIKEAKKIILNF